MNLRRLLSLMAAQTRGHWVAGSRPAMTNWEVAPSTRNVRKRAPANIGDTMKTRHAAASCVKNKNRTFRMENQANTKDDAHRRFAKLARHGRQARMIVVFGSITVDLITPVAALPHVGETVIGGDYTIIPGGKGANQALAAALGAAPGQSVTMIGTIGADAWGALALEHLRKAGVDLTLVGTGERRTACGFISVDANGQTLITVSPGANIETRADAIAKLRAPLAPATGCSCKWKSRSKKTGAP
jgi:hypothetical protein